MANVDRKLSSRKCAPGGYKCRCCGPSPGKGRKEFRRLVKRGPGKSFVRREIASQLEG